VTRPWTLISLLLEYPGPEPAAAGADLERAAARMSELANFLAWRRGTSLEEQRQEYVRTFDFDRRASLHLTYHTHGDRRQRGLELVRLKRRFRDAGLDPPETELPDYLPLLLEFAALVPGDGEALLAELRVPLELVRARLHDRGSAYADLLDAVIARLPKLTKAQVAVARRLAEEGPPTELVGLEPFGAGVAS
jgi:nitrate reductase delta subunit